MSTVEKAEVLEKVAASPAPTRQVLRDLGVPKSTYYRWRARSRSPNRPQGSSGRRVPWNRLAGDEKRTVLRVALASPEWSSRQPRTGYQGRTGRTGLIHILAVPDKAPPCAEVLRCAGHL